MICLMVLLSLLVALPVIGDETPNTQSAVSSEIGSTEAGELYLAQSMDIEASVSEVWAAYTTTGGWQSWVAPVVEMDFRAGGQIRTHYTPGASIGDEGTNRLQIVNYVPERLLTLQADVTPNWPEFLREEEERLFNVVLFVDLGSNRTRIESYGVGYADDAQHHNLIKFFVSANEHTLLQLKRYLEEGVAIGESES